MNNRVFIIVLITSILLLFTYLFISLNTDVDVEQFTVSDSTKPDLFWSYDRDRKNWYSIKTPPECIEPFTFKSPVNVNLVSGMLYPGQIRGNDYKPHGGFRFNNQTTNKVDVYAPFDAKLFKVAKYMADGEIQYSLFFMNDCGIMYLLGHLKKLTPEFDKVLQEVRVGKEGDSRTTQINPPYLVPEGKLIATHVGFESNNNVFFDFGVYDLRKPNNIEYDEEFRSLYGNVNEYGAYAVCWFDYLAEKDKNIVKNLPAGGVEGKVSDYCE